MINIMNINPTQNDGSSSSLVLLLDCLANPWPSARPIAIFLPVFVYDANPPRLNIVYLYICFLPFNYFFIFISIFFISILFFYSKKNKNSFALFWAKYHRVVSINRPSGYEPDALPLRHDDLFDICPINAYIYHTLLDVSISGYQFIN